MSMGWFTAIIFISILAPFAAAVMLLVLSFGEKEMDYLQLENTRVRLEKELRDSEYMQLSQQIHPHFIFNTLNALMSLARLKRHDHLINGMEQFSLFLRYKYREKSDLTPFLKELEHTRHYLYIQQLRFGQQLHIEETLDAHASMTLIPPYTLQTLVENAFKHGLEKKPGEKKLIINLTRQGNWVHLIVIDNGEVDRETLTKKDTNGIGLNNLRQRFKLLFDLETKIELLKNN